MLKKPIKQVLRKFLRAAIAKRIPILKKIGSHLHLETKRVLVLFRKDLVQTVKINFFLNFYNFRKITGSTVHLFKSNSAIISGQALNFEVKLPYFGEFWGTVRLQTHRLRVLTETRYFV